MYMFQRERWAPPSLRCISGDFLQQRKEFLRLGSPGQHMPSAIMVGLLVCMPENSKSLGGQAKA
jgi:hypothetical protein